MGCAVLSSLRTTLRGRTLDRTLIPVGRGTEVGDPQGRSTTVDEPSSSLFLPVSALTVLTAVPTSDPPPQ